MIARLAFVVVSAAVGSAASGTAAWATVLDSFVKVRPGALPSGSDRASLSLARGECEGAQVLIAPGAEAVTPAIGPPGDVAVRLYREEFVAVATASSSEGATGLWPDPLIPAVDAYAGEARNAFPWSSTAERPLVIYVEACAPAGAAPGARELRLDLAAKNRPAVSIPVHLQIRPFALPATSSLPTSFGLGLYLVAAGHGLAQAPGDARALLDRYADAMLVHRLTPRGMTQAPPLARLRLGKVEVDFTEYDRELAPYFEGRGTPAGARFTTAEVREAPKGFTDEQRTAYYARLRDHFREKGWGAQLFYYAKDEPKPDELPLVLKQAARVNRAGGIPVLVTTSFQRDLIGAAGILCPVLNCFFPRPGPQTCPRVMPAAALREALPKGTRIWWYQSCMSHGCGGPVPAAPGVERAFTGWASYAIDHPTALNRAMGSLAFRAGVDGELYWESIYAFKNKDPWTELYDFGGNGDGTLFYPGTPARIGGRTHVPIESLRLKAIRDGLEDYEYLALLSKQGDQALARQGVEKLVRSGYEIGRDPRVWAQVRGEIADALSRHLEPAGAAPDKE